MKKLLKDNWLFLVLTLLLIISLSVMVGVVPKWLLHWQFCHRHTAAWDTIMPIISDTANWLPYVLSVSIILFWKLGDGVFMGASLGISAIVIQGVKRSVCAPRPLTYFAENYPSIQLPIVPGVRMNYALSFPSGHTTTFFAMTLALSIIIMWAISKSNSQADQRRRNLPLIVGLSAQMGLFSFAVLGAYSRIYLSQHFAADILGGCIFGTVITLLLSYWLQQYREKNWWNWSLRLYRRSK